MFKSGIYRIINTINQKEYIGSAIYISNRFSVHKYKLKNNKHINKKLQNAYNKYGEDIFTFEVIEHCDRNELITREQHFIDERKPFYNISKFATSALGNKYFLGKKHSEETKKKLSIIHSGKTLSKEHINNISLANKGKLVSEETKNKMTEAAKKLWQSRRQNGTLIFNRNKQGKFVK